MANETPGTLQTAGDGMTRTGIAQTIVSAIGACPLLFSSAVQPALACTGIRLTAEDGTVVHARTLEFAIDLHSDIMMVPRGYARTGTTPDGKEGLKWTTKYASVGLNGVGLPVLSDGVNEKGLATGTFYSPTSAGYMSYAPGDTGKTTQTARRGIPEVGLEQSVFGDKPVNHALYLIPTRYTNVTIDGISGDIELIVHPVGGESMGLFLQCGKFETPMQLALVPPGFPAGCKSAGSRVAIALPAGIVLLYQRS
jgi:Linear amide C-N hydrolases, choloylglycine hydrolase family